MAVLCGIHFIFSVQPNSQVDYIEKPLSVNSSMFTIEQIEDEFDYFQYDEEKQSISAYNYQSKDTLEDKIDVNLIESDSVRFSYEAEYVEEENLIYLAVSVFDESDNLIDVSVLTATPIKNGDVIDAKMLIEGKEIYLSEILQGDAENCFFFSIFLGSLFAAKVVAALVVTAKVVATVVAVVVVAGVTYELVKVTKDWLKERENECTIAKNKNPQKPKIYYMAKTSGNALSIAPVPVDILVASSNVKNSRSSYWTAVGSDASALMRTAFGTCSSKAEIDRDRYGAPLRGRYWHFHPTDNYHAGIHAWYGEPYAKVYY